MGLTSEKKSTKRQIIMDSQKDSQTLPLCSSLTNMSLCRDFVTVFCANFRANFSLLDSRGSSPSLRAEMVGSSLLLEKAAIALFCTLRDCWMVRPLVQTADGLFPQLSRNCRWFALPTPFSSSSSASKFSLRLSSTFGPLAPPSEGHPE